MPRRISIVLLVVLLSASAVRGDELRAGVAVADITPPAGYRMSGYFSERLSTGTRDPLLAKALVFRQGDERAALVFLDLIGIPADVTRRVRERAFERAGIAEQNIALCCTHTHTGPLYAGAMRNFFHEQAVARTGSDAAEAVDYPAELVEKVAEAIARASQQAAEVTLEAGFVEQRDPQLSFNRRFHMKNGSVVFNPGQQNPDIVRVAGPIDPEVGLLSMRIDGQPLTVLTVFALHLDTVGGTEYSADYPGHLQRALGEEVGGEVVSLFGAGTCGDINHVDVAIQGRRSSQEIGAQLAKTVASGLKALWSVERPSLAVRRAIVEVPKQQFTEEQIAAAVAQLPKIGTRELSFLEQVEAYKIAACQLYPPEVVPIEVQAFRLGQDVAIVTLPGEVFVELGLAIKQASPFKTTLVIELANDAPGYIPTQKAFAEGSYETVNSRIQTGGGERMVEAAVKLLRELKD